MKKIFNLIIFLLLLTFVCGLIIYGNKEQSKEISSAKIQDAPLLRKPIKQNFLYNQLTEQEQSIYNKLITGLNEFEPKCIELDEPITPLSLVRINDCILMSRYTMLDFGGYIGGGKSKKIFGDKEDLAKTGIYVIVPIFPNSIRDLDATYDSTDGSDGTLTIEEFNRTAFNWMTDEYIEKNKKMNKEIDHKIKEIIASLPENATQLEVVQYFSDWIIENINYDNNKNVKKLDFKDTDGMNKLYINRTLYGLITKKTICSGYTILLNEFLNSVGIQAYPVIGTTCLVAEDKTSNVHAWNSIRIGSTTRYIDLTALVNGMDMYLLTAKEINRYNWADNHFDYY